jgi:hypothetical protein
MLVRLADFNDLPITLPNPNSTLLVRPLAVPLGLAALCIGFVLWRFMGDVPGALKISLTLLLDSVLGRGKEVHEIALQKPLVLPVQAALDTVKARDTGFHERTLLEHATTVAGAFVEGWEKRDLGACTELVGADCLQAQEKQMLRGFAQGWRQNPAAVTASAERVVAAKVAETSETVTVRIKMVPCDEAIKSVRGRRIGEWIEDWTMTRSVRPPVKGSNRPAFGQWRVERMDHVAVHFERAA